MDAPLREPQAGGDEPIRLRALALPFVAYGAATVWFTWPLGSVAATHVVAPQVLLNDVYLVLWMLSWVGHALLHDPLHLFDGNALYPTPHVIAASEHLLGDMPVFLPVWLATDDAALALNVVIFTSFVLGAVGMHVLARRWTGDPVAAWIAGTAFAFAPWRAELGRPHLLQVQYLPLIAWGLDRVVRGAGLRTALVTAGALALQVLCSYYLGYAAYLMAAAFVLAWLVAGEGRSDAATWRALAVALVLPLVVIVPVSLPYVLVRARGGLTTELTDALLNVWTDFGRPAFVLALYCGWGTAVLAAAGLGEAALRRRSDRTQQVRLVFLVLTMLLGLALAAGPAGVAGGWIAPFVWLAAVVPGFGSLRAPVRFGVLAGFAASALAAYAPGVLQRLLPARAARTVRWPAALLAVAAVIGWAVASPPVHPTVPVPLRDDVSEAHRWLAAHGEGGPLLELPLDRALNVASARAMFVSTYHWLPLLNGYTGYTPPESAFLLAHAQQLPTSESLQLLVDCTGVRWILLHFATRSRREAWHALPGVRLAYEFSPDGDRRQWDDLYEVTAPRRAACPGLFSADTTVAGNPIASVDAPRGTLDVRPPPVVSSLSESAVTIALANDGDVVWPSTAVDPRRRFMLAYSWQPVGTGPAQTAWRRVLIPRDLAPGERLDVAAWIWPPREPGEYRLRVRAGEGDEPAAALVWEGTVRVERTP